MKQVPDATAGLLLIDASGIDQAEEQISTTFSTFRVRTAAVGRNTRIRLWRTYAGTLGIDDVEYTYDLTYEMEAPDDILLVRMRSGVFEETHLGQPTCRHGTGAAVAFGAIEHPILGRLEKARYQMIGVPRRAFAEVAGDHPDSDAIRLTGTTPVSDAANQHVVDVIDHIRHGLLSNPAAADEPLIVSTLTRYLAASMLAAFPHTFADGLVRDLDNHDALRRARTYIDNNAHTDISLACIAHAARVSASTLEAIFTRHLHCTPSEYLRQVRLAHVHDDLAAADPATSTVADIARKWGFWRLGPFSALYRRTYGHPPESTLHH